ncbi:uncharacterized protein LOC755406 [Strongylocentrotus purpuratus]|uniref:YHYH domain-containing protein n=1 Tax=Strongylocentrotus purpuratus TaxID=7668 RepID=A0A7M7G056_STRPU|nr:uncharacterized protein LOC755406 [Strongylocentrotus purpuratus]
MFRAIAAIILVSVIAFVHGLSEEQAELFVTTGQTEMNTGLVGWVSVTSYNRNIWLIKSNDIPDHDTGVFPTRGENPNEIEEQDFSYRIAKNPVVNEESTCLPLGPIAIATNGIVMYNPWDTDDENAVEGEGAEVFDECDGHPDGLGRYHYHKQPSSCLFTIIEGEPSPLVGVAFDGFAIYGPVNEYGVLLTSDDLDECHGRYNSGGVYQYHTTADFPYILGCFRGTPKNVNTNSENCNKASETDEDGNLLP